ncbi:hypothetical protein SAMN05660866_02710 [Maribacter arcticus]|uniref:Uncharacterized protein n=1 Tax=Maribacter arcticus TaxID=561365 RepID=A0A1T5D566_9FLAO|nr:hypothetical protein SAMN05660866_02710 [Maribacter arcticus]
MLKWGEAPLSLGCENCKKTPTLSTNTLSYQQNGVFPLVLLVFVINPYKFVTRYKFFNHN